MDTKKAAKASKKFANRIQKELKLNTESKEFEFAVLGNLWYFKFTVESGVHIGQIHIVEIKLTYGSSPDLYVYPLHPPLCRFITPIMHPNISSKGTICLDVLKENWSSSMYTSTILDALRLLLLNPEPSSPQDQVVAKLYTENITEYEKKVIEFYDYDKVDETIKSLFCG